MNHTSSFLRHHLPAMLLVAILAGCGGGGGGGGGGGASTSPAAAAPSTGSVQHQSRPAPSPPGKAGSVAASTTPPAQHGAPSATAKVPVVTVMPRLERYAGLYRAELTRHRQVEPAVGEIDYQEQRNQGNLWLDISDSGQVFGFWKPVKPNRVKNPNKMSFIQGEWISKNNRYEANLYNARDMVVGRFFIVPQAGAAELTANFVDDEENENDAKIYQSVVSFQDWAGDLRRVDHNSDLPGRQTTLNVSETTFKAVAWSRHYLYNWSAANVLGPDLTLDPIGNDRWSLVNAENHNIRIEAVLHRSATTGACTATMNFSTRGRGAHAPREELNDIAGRCFLHAGVFTLYSTDRMVQLWMTGRLAQH